MLDRARTFDQAVGAVARRLTDMAATLEQLRQPLALHSRDDVLDALVWALDALDDTRAFLENTIEALTTKRRRHLWAVIAIAAAVAAGGALYLVWR